MGENLKLIRPYLVLLAVVTVGRWLLSIFGVPYEKGTHVLSLVTLTIYTSLFYGIFLRRWRRARILEAMGVGATLCAISQVVVLLSTAASYALGIDSYFTNPVALSQPHAVGFVPAMGIRFGGLIANIILNGIAGAVGWALGALLPETGNP